MKKICWVLVLILVAFSCIGCNYSEEQHLKRVEKRIEKRYFGKERDYYEDFRAQLEEHYLKQYEFENYEVHPVYTINDELKYFVVDFKPTGYMYISIVNGDLKFMGLRKYKRASYVPKWARYSYKEFGTLGPQESDYIYETDENGEIIYYTCSHYKAAGVENERLYLLKFNASYTDGYIPAVKRGDKFLNLVSMEEHAYQEECDNKAYVYAKIGFYSKPHFYL